jgi:Arc/MetJ-type ribon-helix-helix transcriptional regulator
LKEHEQRIALRLPTELRQQAEQLITERKVRNLSELIRAALTEYLDKT